jgi:hypothetical protein
MEINLMLASSPKYIVSYVTQPLPDTTGFVCQPKPKRRYAMTKAMTAVCVMVFVGIFLLPCGATAFSQAQIGQLKATRMCPGCDLSGADLSGADLSDANLSGAKLSRAKLSRANLADADLRGADLRRANLANANLSGADLDSADLSGANLSGADLSNGSFEGVTWIDGRKCEDGSIGVCKK